MHIRILLISYNNIVTRQQIPTTVPTTVASLLEIALSVVVDGGGVVGVGPTSENKCHSTINYCYYS